jgi:hypothetical protein
VRIVIVHREREDETATLVHPLVRLDGEREVEDIVRIWERSLHGAAEREFTKICPLLSATPRQTGYTYPSEHAAGPL